MFLPRPAEVRIDRFSPCLVASDWELLRDVNVGHRVQRVDRAVTHSRAVACIWWDSPGPPDLLTMAITVAPDRSASDFLGADSQVTTVAGFGAVDTVGLHADPRKECVLALDVAEGQSVLVTVRNDTGWVPGINHEMMCAKARLAAERVLRRHLLGTR